MNAILNHQVNNNKRVCANLADLSYLGEAEVKLANIWVSSVSSAEDLEVSLTVELVADKSS